MRKSTVCRIVNTRQGDFGLNYYVRDGLNGRRPVIAGASMSEKCESLDARAGLPFSLSSGRVGENDTGSNSDSGMGAGVVGVRCHPAPQEQ